MIIGIPVYNDLENLKKMFHSLLCSSKQNNYLIVLLESESTDGSAEYCDELKKGYSYIPIKVIHTKKEGPLKAYNRLFEIAKERKEDLFLTQTDVTFPKRKISWVYEMQTLAKQENCGMITCWGGGGLSGPDFIDGFRWVGAWCTYIPYRTIEKLGGYDENIPLGWGVDIDYSYAVIKAGLQILQINYWVDHNPNYSEGHEHEKIGNIEQIKKDAYTYMRKKWKVGEFAE